MLPARYDDDDDNEKELFRCYTVFFITPFFAIGKRKFKKRIFYLFIL